MSDFDPNAFKSRLDTFIQEADEDVSNKYQSDLDSFSGLSEAQIHQFGGTTQQMKEIIAEVDKAKSQNISQAQLIDNIKALGKSTYELAQKVTSLVP